MATRVEGDYFSIECRGKIVIIELRNTETTPVFDLSAMHVAVEAIKQAVADNNLTSGGWHALYDFSQLNHFDMAVWPIMAKSARWALSNGRQRHAHIFPTERNPQQMQQIKQVVESLIAVYGFKTDFLHTVTSIEEGIAYLNSDTAAAAAA